MWAVGASRWGRLPPARGAAAPNHRISNTGKRGLGHPKQQVSCRSSLVVERPAPIVVSPPLRHRPIPPAPPPTPEPALSPFVSRGIPLLPIPARDHHRCPLPSVEPGTEDCPPSFADYGPKAHPQGVPPPGRRLLAPLFSRASVGRYAPLAGHRNEAQRPLLPGRGLLPKNPVSLRLPIQTTQDQIYQRNLPSTSTEIQDRRKYGRITGDWTQ
ncbi:PREDICTED: wiskott-Aldrich syndrome protein family member 1-like [Cercocebus atys]|uniref:wiskott-Aldrich syndrome protein family member 1-like n=1 Tax=Cercocebus atys TaxID=9531 RepID=UPI0005F5444C|nr:PREDICTED: wiskott-Aldrich syndrome protein family member 1-like [Cercocebus atys]